MSSSSRRGTLGLGAAVAVSGALMVNGSTVDADHNGKNEYIFDDNFGLLVPGTLMVIAGIAMVLAGVTAQEPATPPSAISPVIDAGASAPGDVMPRAEPSANAPLPELPATAEVLRLAQQARSASALALCDAAWNALRMIDEQDARYAAALLNGPAMAECRR